MNQVIEDNIIAPDFKLRDQHGNRFRLSDHHGHKVLLSFHPLAWTPICAQQMQSLEKNMDTFTRHNTIPVGISIDSQFTKEAWAKNLNIEQLRLLADFWPHGEVARLFGLFRDRNGFSERANILIDEDGRVSWVKVYEIKQLPDIQEVLEQIE